MALDTGINTTTSSNVTAPGGTRIPGRSPFTYVGSPARNLLRIDSLEMSPNPCTLRAQCAISAKGFFKQNIPSIRLKFNITSESDRDPKPVFVIEDDFCDWVDVIQGGVKSCPPRKGPAVINFRTLLVQGWIPEAKYGIDIEVNSKAGMVSHIYTDLQLEDPMLKSS